MYSMILHTLLISAILLVATCSSASVQVVPKKYLRHTEKIAVHVPSFNNQGIPHKSERLSNNEGNIVVTFDETLSDSIQTSILAAKKLWESKLPTTQPIYISVLFESLGSEVSMISEVAYCETSNLKGCPCALASQISNFPYGSTDSPDGYIILNSDINWNCRFTNDATSEYNLPTMILRGIARCLGFGSSIIEDGINSYSFLFSWPTYFDNLLYFNNKALSTVEQGSSEMNNFVKSNQVYAHTESQKHKIYAPSKFTQNKSLCYFDNKNSIMSYSLGQGNVDLSIDDETSDILRTIGWDLPISGLTIRCNNIGNNGIGSSYESHTFSLKKENENVSNYNWRFLLKNKQGNFTQISSGTSANFTITKIDSPDNLFININGDLEGRIECEYTLNNKRYSASPFTLSLELKPIILSIDNISSVNHGQYEFSLNFNVQYTGADYVSVEIEEEYNTTLRNYRFDEPYIAHIKTGNITNLYYSWVNIIVSNKYGSTYETMEFAPSFDSSRTKEISSMTDISLDSILKEIYLYDMQGNLMFIGTPSEFNNKPFKSGIYLKKEIFDDGFSKISKILFR